MAQHAAHMASVLEDTQESLSAALARIEALRSREKALTGENDKLRRSLKAAAAASDGAQNGLEEDSTEKEPQGETPSVQEGGPGTVQHFPVLLYTNKGKALAAMVEQTEDSLVFYEQRARINAADLVGMGGVHMPEKVSGGKSSSIMSYFLGKSKYFKARDKDILQNTAEVAPVGDSLVHDVYFRAGSETCMGHTRTSFESYLGKLQAKGSMSIDEGLPAELIHNVSSEHNGSLVRQILWKDGRGSGKLKKIIFEAASSTLGFIRQQMDTWSNHTTVPLEDSSASNSTYLEVHQLEASQKNDASLGAEGELVPPKHFIPDGHLPTLDSKSALLTEDHLKCLTGAIPNRHRLSPWKLLYSTAKDGFSLQTMYRKAAGVSPCILVLHDMSDYLFGAYTSEAWKVSPRFFGTGETFVFQLEPHRIYYPWKKKSNVSNAFFMYASPDSIGVGGTGNFSIWLDGELLCGSSGLCDTFGSPCLSKDNDFKIKKMELWGLQ